MKIQLFPLLILACLLIIPLSAQEAASVRIAVLDMTKLFESHPATAPALQTLTAAREASSARYTALSTQLKTKLQTHQEQIRANQKDSAIETLKQANELEKALASLGTKEYRDTQEKFRERKLYILKDIQDQVRDYNKTAKYTLILDLSAASPNGLPQVVDPAGCTDITQAMIAHIAKNQ